MRRLPLVFALLSFGGIATADDAATTEEHRAFMISAQVLRKEGKLLRARDLLLTCAARACPEGESAECEEIRAFCTKKQTEVAAEIPRVTLAVHDDRGLPLRPQLVELDTVPVDATKTLELDPGPHTAKATYLGRTGTTAFVLARGDSGPTIDVRVDLRETVFRRPIPAPVFVFGGTAITTGLLALGMGIYTAERYGALDACRPTCDPAERGTLRATSYVADVSMIVALAAAVVTTVWYLARPTVSEVRWLQPVEGSAR